jgi:RNA polymerase sigma-70 factor (ECF subfamily)
MHVPPDEPGTGRGGPRQREIDELTVARAQRGDERACRALVLRYQDPVFRLLSRVLGRRRRDGLVPDLAQETFLRVFRQLSSFTVAGPGRLSTWILTIATRIAIDELRRFAPETTSPEEAETLAAGTRADEDAESQEALAIIERALGALPADWRAVLLLRLDHDLEYADIAQALGIEIGTVRSRLARARAALWEALAELRGTP